MEYSEALKKVRAEKPKDNFMVIQINDDKRLVLPYKAGAAVIEAMSHAEKFNERWGTPTRIIELERGYLKAHSMSHKEYEDFKIAALLNLSIDEVRSLAEQQPK